MGVTLMKKATTQTVNTTLISHPTISVSANFTALHLAAIAWDLYCETAPTHFAGEFTIVEGGDFSMYGIPDSMDMAQHYYDCAYSIGESVQQDVNYSVQDAYNQLDDICADTVVREDVSCTVYNAVAKYVHTEDGDSSIAWDYKHITEEQGNTLPKQIAQLEEQLATLRARASA